MKIKTKLFAGFFLVVLLIMVIGIYGILANRSVVGLLTQHISKDMPANESIASLRLAMAASMRAVEEYDAGWISRDDAKREVAEQNKAIKSDLNALLMNDAAKAREQEDAIIGFNALGDELIAAHDKSREEKTPIMEKFDEKAESINASFDVWEQKNTEDLNAKVALVHKKVDTFMIMNTILVPLFVLISLLIIYFMSATIIAPIEALKNAASSMSGGDYEIDIKPSSMDEIGKLTVIFNEMAQGIKQSRQQIEEKSQEIVQKNKELMDTLEEFYTLRIGMARDMEKGTLEMENRKIKEKISELGKKA